MEVLLQNKKINFMFCQSLASKLLCEMPQVPQIAFDSKSNKTTQYSVLADLILSVNSSPQYQVNIVKCGDSEILVPVLQLHTYVPTRGNISITVEPKHYYFITITILKISTEKLWMPHPNMQVPQHSKCLLSQKQGAAITC